MLKPAICQLKLRGNTHGEKVAHLLGSAICGQSCMGKQLKRHMRLASANVFGELHLASTAIDTHNLFLTLLGYDITSRTEVSN